jgi:hypothetical protein
MVDTGQIRISPETLSLIAEIDEFKGAWRAFGTLAPEPLSGLRRVATIESIGSSTRIEDSQPSARDVEHLLDNLEVQPIANHCLGPVSVSPGSGDGRPSSHGFADSQKVQALRRRWSAKRTSLVDVRRICLPASFPTGFAHSDAINGARNYSFLRRYHWHARVWKVMGKLARIPFGLLCNRSRGPEAYTSARIP